MIFTELFFAALGIGIVSSILGVGGGIFMVPLLTLAGFVPSIREAAGTSIAGVVFTSLSSSIVYWSQGKINFRIGLLLMPTTILGAWWGAQLTEVIDPHWLAAGFGALLLYPISMMIQGKEPKNIRFSLHGELTGARLYPTAVILGLIAGTASGLFGIGGGTVMVPALAVFLGLDIITAAATSLFVMVPGAVMGAVQHWLEGNLRIALAIPLILGITIGAQIGPRIGTHIPKRRLRQGFGVILLYAAANMFIKAFY